MGINDEHRPVKFGSERPTFTLSNQKKKATKQGKTRPLASVSPSSSIPLSLPVSSHQAHGEDPPREDRRPAAKNSVGVKGTPRSSARSTARRLEAAQEKGQTEKFPAKF